MAKHISSPAFYIVTWTIWGGGVATPETPSRSTHALPAKPMHACAFVEASLDTYLEILQGSKINIRQGVHGPVPPFPPPPFILHT